jgi:hypothetical protein
VGGLSTSCARCPNLGNSDNGVGHGERLGRWGKKDLAPEGHTANSERAAGGICHSVLWQNRSVHFYSHKIACSFPFVLIVQGLDATSYLPAYAPWYLLLNAYTVAHRAPFSQLSNCPNQYGIA